MQKYILVLSSYIESGKHWYLFLQKKDLVQYQYLNDGLCYVQIHNDHKKLLEELNIMKSLDHPNIIKVY